MTRPTLLSRRAFLIRTSGFAVAGLWAPAPYAGSENHTDLARRLAQAFEEDVAPLAALGRIYLRSLTEPPTAAALADRLFDEVPRLAHACRRADKDAIRSVLWNHFRAEFAAGRMIYLGRFALAPSEARFYALMALLNHS